MDVKKLIVAFSSMILSNLLPSQNILDDSGFDKLSGSDGLHKKEFISWEPIDYKVYKKILYHYYYEPPVKAFDYNVNDFINIYTNTDGEFKNNFAFIRLFQGNYSGLFQEFEKLKKENYFLFSIRVKQNNDTVGCSFCNIPLQIIFANRFVSPYEDLKHTKGLTVITVPLHSHASISNPWIKYNFVVKLKKNQKYMVISNFENSRKKASQERYAAQSNYNRQIDSDFYIDDVTLLPVYNKDTLFPLVEKRSLKPVAADSFIIGKIYNYEECNCFGQSRASILGKKTIDLLDSIAYVVRKNKSWKVTIVMSSEKNEVTEKIVQQINNYLYYYIEDDRQIDVTYLDISHVTRVSESQSPKHCPKSYWVRPLVREAEFIRVSVGFKFERLNN